MEIVVNDLLKLRKMHPCGSNVWKVLRIGADFRIECQGCKHQMMIPRTKIEKNIKDCIRNGENIQLF